MSRLTELQRKAALLRYYLIKREEFPSKDIDQIELLGIGRGGFKKWINGQSEKPRVLDEADRRLKQALNILDTTPNLFGEDIGVMQLGKLLGLSRLECQRAIDSLAGELGPTFSIFSLPNSQAEEVLNVFGGLYTVYRLERTELARRLTNREESVVCMAMSVRYKLSGSKLMSANLHRVRCKLNVPAYRLSNPVHEYDGYVTAPDSGGRHYWMFEVRRELEKDVIFMTTESLRRGLLHAPERRLALGTMVTRTQDAPSVPGIWPIVIVRQPDPRQDAVDETFEDTAEKRFIARETRLCAPAEVPEWVLAALKEAQDFARPCGEPLVREPPAASAIH